MSEKVPQKHLVPIVKDMVDGEICLVDPDAMSVDLDGRGWINPYAHCHGIPHGGGEVDTTGFTGLILEKVGARISVNLSALRGHQYTRAPRPSLHRGGEDWIEVAGFIDSD